MLPRPLSGALQGLSGGSVSSGPGPDDGILQNHRIVAPACFSLFCFAFKLRSIYMESASAQGDCNKPLLTLPKGSVLFAMRENSFRREIGTFSRVKVSLEFLGTPRLGRRAAVITAVRTCEQHVLDYVQNWLNAWSKLPVFELH